MKYLIVLVVVVAAAGCSKSNASKQYPDTKEGLAALVADLRSDTSRAKQLALPDPKGWLTATFGDEKIAEYLLPDVKAATGLLSTVANAMQKKHAEGKNVVLVEQFTSADDPEATGRQSFVLRNAKKPLTLYSVRLHPPGSPDGRSVHFYSFVYVDGGFRFLGPLKSANAAKAPASGDSTDAAVEALAEMRNRHREEYLKTGRLPGDPPKPPLAEDTSAAAVPMPAAAPTPAKAVTTSKQATPAKPARKTKPTAKNAGTVSGEPKDAFFPD